MRRILSTGKLGVGERLNYREAIWLWRNNSGGFTLTAARRVLTTDNWMSGWAGGSVVGPDIFDDVRIYGNEELDLNGFVFITLIERIG